MNTKSEQNESILWGYSGHKFRRSFHKIELFYTRVYYRKTQTNPISNTPCIKINSNTNSYELPKALAFRRSPEFPRIPSTPSPKYFTKPR